MKWSCRYRVVFLHTDYTAKGELCYGVPCAWSRLPHQRRWCCKSRLWWLFWVLYGWPPRHFPRDLINKTLKNIKKIYMWKILWTFSTKLVFIISKFDENSIFVNSGDMIRSNKRTTKCISTIMLFPQIVYVFLKF